MARPPAPATLRLLPGSAGMTTGARPVSSRRARNAGSPRPSRARVARAMTMLDAAVGTYGLPVVEKIAEENRADPFKVLVSTMLSARTQDATTDAASRRLFARARSPRSLGAVRVRESERLIYPV